MPKQGRLNRNAESRGPPIAQKHAIGHGLRRHGLRVQQGKSLPRLGHYGGQQCDTLVKLPTKRGADDVTGAVGACKSQDCRYNNALECSAPEIRIGHHGDHADCRTYRSN